MPQPIRQNRRDFPVSALFRRETATNRAAAFLRNPSVQKHLRLPPIFRESAARHRNPLKITPQVIQEQLFTGRNARDVSTAGPALKSPTSALPTTTNRTKPLEIRHFSTSVSLPASTPPLDSPRDLGRPKPPAFPCIRFAKLFPALPNLSAATAGCQRAVDLPLIPHRSLSIDYGITACHCTRVR